MKRILTCLISLFFGLSVEVAATAQNACADQLQGMQAKNRQELRSLTVDSAASVLLNDLERKGLESLARFSTKFVALENTAVTIRSYAYSQANSDEGYRVDVLLAGGAEGTVYLRQATQNWFIIMVKVKVLDQEKLFWPCEYRQLEDSEIEDYLLAIAAEGGEGLEFGKFADRVQPVGFAKLPDLLKDRAVDYWVDQDLNASDEEGLEISLGDEAYQILDARGVVVGYIVLIDYNIEHALFDGGGLIIYFDAKGRLVTETEWWG